MSQQKPPRATAGKRPGNDESAGAGKRAGAGKAASSYEQRLARLLQLVEVAAEVLAAARDVKAKDKREMLAFGRETKELALAPPPGVPRVIAGLKQLEADFLTYWNEASGEHADEFWRRVAAAGLPFVRRDLVREALNRGRIRSLEEYEAIVDGLVVLEQLGKVTPAETEALGEMIARYERRLGG